MLDSLTNQDMIILFVLIGLIIVVGILCIIFSLKGNKVEKKVVKEEKKVTKEPDIKMALATEDIPEISEQAPKLESMFESIKQEQEENKTDEEIEIMQDEKNKSSIEEILGAMNEDIERQKYEKIDRYEEDQEENAVISYQELVERKMALQSEEPVNEVKETIEKTTYEEDGDRLKPVEYKKVELTSSTPEFKSSDFISPIYGRQANTANYPTVKKVEEKTVLSEDETDEFLDSLKKFRSSL